MRTSACPACGADGVDVARAVLAPFVADLTRTPHPQPVRLMACGDCGLTFFDRRYDAREVELLYGGYRGVEYVRARRTWEPWYGSQVNEAFEPGSQATMDRVGFATNVLRESGAPGKFACVVDFGGDQGQLMPDVEAAKRVVIDVSDAGLSPGVERVASLDEVDVAPDLVIAAHVLEHLSEPGELLAEVRAAMVDHGYVYVEVPLDRPRVKAWHRSTRYGSWLKIVSRHRWAFICVDFMTGAARQFGLAVPRAGIVKQSEHINYFNETSLRRLLERTGFEVLAVVSERSAKVGPLRLGRMGVVARSLGTLTP